MAVRKRSRNHAKWRRYHVKRQRGICHWCDRYMMAPSLDHVVPLAEGGRDHLENTVAACEPCNSEKGRMSPDEWRRLLATRVPKWARLNRAELETKH